MGESGSGKSVTARAIMGILAGNSMVENGEIIYDGQDLLKISEDDFHTLARASPGDDLPGSAYQRSTRLCESANS